jgi:hypothetical protein
VSYGEITKNMEDESYIASVLIWIGLFMYGLFAKAVRIVGIERPYRHYDLMYTKRQVVNSNFIYQKSLKSLKEKCGSEKLRLVQLNEHKQQLINCLRSRIKKMKVKNPMIAKDEIYNQLQGNDDLFELNSSVHEIKVRQSQINVYTFHITRMLKALQANENMLKTSCIAYEMSMVMNDLRHIPNTQLVVDDIEDKLQSTYDAANELHQKATEIDIDTNASLMMFENTELDTPTDVIELLFDKDEDQKVSNVTESLSAELV